MIREWRQTRNRHSFRDDLPVTTSTSSSKLATPNPWYREPWPWIVMAAPAASVIAGVAMLWLAISSNDGLVTDDYYRRGLAINQDLSRDQRAAELGLKAEVSLGNDGSRIRVRLESATSAVLPAALQVRLAHRTRAGSDQSATLLSMADGRYQADLMPPGPGLWRLSIEDPARTWRLAGPWQIPNQEAIVLDALRVER
jgi:hypothetical protein